MHYEQNANPGIHSPPSYVALNRDARTACATTIHDIASQQSPWQYLNSIYCIYTAAQDLMYCTSMQ